MLTSIIQSYKLGFMVYFLFENIPPRKQKDSTITSEGPVLICNFKYELQGVFDKNLFKDRTF